MADIVPVETMDEFVRKYRPWVRQLIQRKFNIRGANLDDVEQEVYLKMIRFKTLETYDPRKGVRKPTPFSTHIFLVIRSVALNYIRAEKANALSQAEPLYLKSSEGGEFLHPLVASGIEDSDPLDRIFAMSVLKRLLKILEEHGSWFSEGVGGVTKKNFKEVASYILQGYKGSEIAKHYKVSPSAIVGWKGKMRDILSSIPGADDLRKLLKAL